ncbi:M23 family metallopeptidase [Galbitalea soli]|uniref:M23 family metallopeptidase n=1 Tax=Galbitalea soli TaxID=1268042 RepID=A0A7C9PMP2_9MICO|nr:M23 family metallopeptidase [Galbitalea soli]NEM91052.1 M23 family metallopeptidase [Galbitalea soli]NYJ29740.1 murein DD-endopeptidase MepM/ murein hydrolase activator NlpD [Galbitalea soli]
MTMPPALPSRRELREQSSPKARKAAARAQREREKRRARLRVADVPRKSIAKRLIPVGALGFAAALMFATSLPASALLSPGAVAAAATETAAKAVTATGGTTAAGGQVLAPVSATGEAAAVPLADDGISVMSYAEVQKLNYTFATGSVAYTVNNSGPIRWPFPVAVPLGDLFGPRAAPCAGCSTFHHGIDFQPGDGAPIYAIAAGVVSQVDHYDASLGNVVYITHTIGGQQITSLYGHMQEGSSSLKVGQKVAEGDLVGLVGSTGESSGPHLHLGILEGGPTGPPINPLPWLIAHTAH